VSGDTVKAIGGAFGLLLCVVFVAGAAYTIIENNARIADLETLRAENTARIVENAAAIAGLQRAAKEREIINDWIRTHDAFYRAWMDEFFTLNPQLVRPEKNP
jgi:hypothetical protein